MALASCGATSILRFWILRSLHYPSRRGLPDLNCSGSLCTGHPEGSIEYFHHHKNKAPPRLETKLPEKWTFSSKPTVKKSFVEEVRLHPLAESRTLFAVGRKQRWLISKSTKPKTLGMPTNHNGWSLTSPATSTALSRLRPA